MTQEEPNPLRKECGQIDRRVFMDTLTVTTYKTYALKTHESYDYDWDHRKNRTLMIPRKPMFKKNDFVLLVKVYNQKNGVSNYDLYKLDNTHIFGIGRDTGIIQQDVYVDKKWL